MLTYRTPRTKGLAITATVVLISGLTLAGCSTSSPDTSTPATTSASSNTFLAEYDLAGLDGAQIVDRLDSTPVADRPTTLMASVRPDVLVLSAEQGQEVRLPMPTDEFYVSIAPYEDKTHDCYNHSLTTCLGELRNAEVQVALTDNETGEVLVDETKTTFDNGFVGLWIPRDIEATLTITREGRTGTATISTMNDDDPTCITTLQLT